MKEDRFYNGPIALQYWPDVRDAEEYCEKVFMEEDNECTCVSGCMGCLDLSWDDFL